MCQVAVARLSQFLVWTTQELENHSFVAVLHTRLCSSENWQQIEVELAAYRAHPMQRL